MTIDRFADLIVHVGHNVVVAAYDDDGNPVRVSDTEQAVGVTVECVTCSEVLFTRHA